MTGRCDLAQCLKCGLNFLKDEGLCKHTKCVHDKKEPMRSSKYRCDRCAVKFLVNDDFKKHKLHEEFSCELCEMKGEVSVLPTKCEYTFHIITHRIGKPKICDNCGTKFKNNKNLKNHKEQDKTVSCRRCNQIITGSCSLQRHIYEHINEHDTKKEPKPDNELITNLQTKSDKKRKTNAQVEYSKGKGRDISKESLEKLFGKNVVAKVISTQAERYSDAFSGLINPENELNIVTKGGIVSQMSEKLIKFSSPLIKSILNDVPCCSSSIILIPDVSNASVDHVISIITTGMTASSSKEIQNIKDTAMMLGIDFTNLLPDNVNIMEKKHDNDGVLVNIIKDDDYDKKLEVKTEVNEYFEECHEEYKQIIKDDPKLIERKDINTEYEYSVNVDPNLKDKRENADEGASVEEEVKNHDTIATNYNLAYFNENSDQKKSKYSESKKENRRKTEAKTERRNEMERSYPSYYIGFDNFDRRERKTRNERNRYDRHNNYNGLLQWKECQSYRERQTGYTTFL